MRGIVGYLIGGIAMAAIGAVCILFARLDKDLVRAETDVVAEHYDEPQAVFDRAARYYDLASRVPWLGNAAANALRARQALLRYWQRQYGAIEGETGDPVLSVPADNVDLQFVVANSVYRDFSARAKDRATTLEALDAGINSYTTVLKNAGHHEDASYNYELLARLRDEIEQGKRKVLPPPETDVRGREGKNPDDEDTTKFKTYVPLDPAEFENKNGNAGKREPVKRKG